MCRMTGQNLYSRIILWVTFEIGVNIPATIQCSAVGPDFVSNLELKACKVDLDVHRLPAYLVWAIGNGGGLDTGVISSGQMRLHCCEEA